MDAAHVRAGANSNANFAGSSSLCVGTNDATAHHNTYATVIKFAVTNPAGVTAAVLRLRVATLSTNLTSDMPLLLLGMASNDWTAATVAWNGLAGTSGVLKSHPPTGSTSTWKVDSIANNFINWDAPGLQIVGKVTLPSDLNPSNGVGSVKMVDVTSFVQQSSGVVSFVLIRPFRNNQEVASGNTIAADLLNSGAVACFNSATAPFDMPQLLMF